MDKATYVVAELPERTIVLALMPNQLASRREGDLITAEIVSVQPADARNVS